ncbi:glycosyltransferase [Clostridium sp.]|uniref:glycosyltransferase family 2 protein n=1 Tax=Clostridium sp. TaxID=1506 RepID=UPI002FCCA4A2
MMTYLFIQLALLFNYFVIVYLIFNNSLHFLQIVMGVSIIDFNYKRSNYLDYEKYKNSESMIPISLLVPAYNEEVTIVDSINSFLSLDYKLYEIIVINDGSSDATLEKLIHNFDLVEMKEPVRRIIATKSVRGVYRNVNIPNLIIIDKENGGKADALNCGINVSRYPLFVSVDADCILDKESLTRISFPFIIDKTIVAAGGVVRIANESEIEHGNIKKIKLPQKYLSMFQLIEYLRAFFLGRAAFDYFHSLLIISGAFGAFKKETIVKLGGYTPNTIGEDMELILKIHKYLTMEKEEYKILFLPDPICWTQVPERLKDLKSQRERWQIGLMDCLIKHKDMFFNSRYGLIGLIAIPYYWIFEFLGPLIDLGIFIVIPILMYFDIIRLAPAWILIFITLLIGMIQSLSAILTEQFTFNKYSSIKQLIKLSGFSILENFGYRQLIVFFRISGMVKYRKNKNKWGKIERKSFTEE